MPVTRRGFLRAVFPCVAPAGEIVPTTLVTVFLRGGADGLNMLVPYGDPDYASLRPSLAISPPGDSDGCCLDLDGFFGLNPAFAPLLPAYQEGRLAALHAVGSDDESRSHFEAQDQMEHGAAFSQQVAGGWLARYLHSLGVAGGLSSVAIGTSVPESLRGAPMAAAMTTLAELKLRGADATRDPFMKALGELYAGEGLLGEAGADTLELMRRVEALESASEEPGVSYPAGGFARGLQDVARLVKARVGLQVASLDLGGWDTHFFQESSGALSSRIGELANGLEAFQRDLGTCREHVVVVVMTEFGRRAYENASLGTDHGRGSAMFVLADGIQGGQVHGEWPGLTEESLEGPGDLRVTTDYRSALSEVLTRVGGRPPPESVFPGFTPRPVGLVVG